MNHSIAYFSMEIGIENKFKNFAGGLGILAGDTLKSAADLGLNMVGITLNYSKGYFKQVLDTVEGFQTELPDNWNISEFMVLEDKTFKLEFFDGIAEVRIWRYDLIGIKSKIPVYFLDTDFDQNNSENRSICHNLYTNNDKLRTKQEILLGIGGVLAMQTLKYNIFDKYHLNESHAAFAILALRQKMNQEEVKKHVCFTTHTPVLHGHKVYNLETLNQILAKKYADLIQSFDLVDNQFNMTSFCLSNAIYSNAVSKKHAEVSREIFPGFEIDFITNGVHSPTWATNFTQDLFNKYLDGWKENPMVLRNALEIPNNEISETHLKNKRNLLDFISQRTGQKLSENIFTIGFGRRVDKYKRQNLILRDLKKIQQIAEKFNGLQIIFSGKAYPKSEPQNGSISEIYKLSKTDLGKLQIVYIPNYDMEVSLNMVSGCDLWLNNPLKPLEASGTSGMKAALNGNPNLSTVDGWWLEGLIENETGWGIGDEQKHQDDDLFDSNQLYKILEEAVLPTYFLDSKKWFEIQKQAIALNASYFNTERMLMEYITKAYMKT